jgi:HPt (histidine-containing phosphotransfer) domain-containing protein
MSVTHLNTAILDELKDILEGEFPVLLDTYIRDSIARVQELEQALAAGDATTLRKAAHSLKGSSGNLGLQLMAQYCNDIEEAGRTGVIAGLAPLLESLRQERVTVEQILRQRL